MLTVEADVGSSNGGWPLVIFGVLGYRAWSAQLVVLEQGDLAVRVHLLDRLPPAGIQRGGHEMTEGVGHLDFTLRLP